MTPEDKVVAGIVGFFLIDRLIKCLSHVILNQPLDPKQARCRVELGLMVILTLIFGVR